MAKGNSKLNKTNEYDGLKRYKGTMASTGEKVEMINNGQMADGSLTYVRADSKNFGMEKDGKVRQYQMNRKRRFYLMTED